MTKKELIEAMKNMPDDAEVFTMNLKDFGFKKVKVKFYDDKFDYVDTEGNIINNFIAIF